MSEIFVERGFDSFPIQNNFSCFIILIEIMKMKSLFFKLSNHLCTEFEWNHGGSWINFVETGGYLQQIVTQICLTKHGEEKGMEPSHCFKKINAY